jgi:chromatin modification-related protein YNG2
MPCIERKVTGGVASSASIKLPSPAPPSVPALPQRTRHAQQQSHRPSPARGRQVQPEPPGPDEDAEGEDDVEDGNGDDDEDNEDKTLYCFCQKMSYGEVRATRHIVLFILTNFDQMVACDNAECTYQWVSVLMYTNRQCLLTLVSKVSSPVRQPQAPTPGGVVLL